MKKLLIALLVVASFSTFAQTKKVMNKENITILNDIIGAISRTNEAKIFIKNTGFDKVSISSSPDGNRSIIEASGVVLFSGDIACGNLNLKIERSYVSNGWGLFSVYKATLDKTDLLESENCKLQE